MTSQSCKMTSRPVRDRMRPWLSLFLHFVCLMSNMEAAAILPSHLKSTDSNRIINGAGMRKKHMPGTRPMPSDDLPIAPLQIPDGKFPKDTDLDLHTLQQLLGTHMDPDYMSPVRPVESIYNPNGTYEYDFKRSMPVGEMPKDIRTLAFTLPGRTKKVKIKSKSNRRRIQRYLSTYTYCPVHYKWKDLGLRFWPRWIREGDCSSSLGRSCSIPAGMTCKAEQSTKKTLLWWHCRGRSPCKWIFIQYPIITKCACKC